MINQYWLLTILYDFFFKENKENVLLENKIHQV